jgi:hypothetical protein
MKRAIRLAVIGLAFLAGFAAKQYVESWQVGSADWTKILILKQGRTLKADLYWNLYSATGAILQEGKQTHIAKTYAKDILDSDAAAFFTTNLMNEIKRADLEFSGNARPVEVIIEP